MSDPDIVQVATLLRDKVAVGDLFHTATLFADLPKSVAHYERRMRTLKPLGWVIHSTREDKSIESGWRRLVTIGNPIWDPLVSRSTPNYMTTARDLTELDASPLSDDDLRLLRQWFIDNARPPSAVDVWWDLYRRAPDRLKERLRAVINDELLSRLT